MDGVIEVVGADLMDGTPIYDVKPYISYVDSHPEARGGFTDKKEWKLLSVVIAEEYSKLFECRGTCCLRGGSFARSTPTISNMMQRVFMVCLSLGRM